MKYIITDRRCGLGDAILNLAASWYIAREYGCGVIIDWRRLPYTLKDEKTFERHHLNLYNSIYKLPDPIDGVSFHFPEESYGALIVRDQQIILFEMFECASTKAETNYNQLDDQ